LDRALEILFNAGMLSVMGLCVSAYFLTKFFGSTQMNEITPFKVAAVVFVVTIFSFPTGERWLFEKTINKVLRENPFLSTKSVVFWGAIGEPITWFGSFPGSVILVSPAPFLYEFGKPHNNFNEVQYRFQKSPIHRLVDVDCEDQEIWYSRADKEGIFRYQTEYPEVISASDHQFFCQTDFTDQARLINDYAKKKGGF
jgi:hypothetical protein